MPHKLQQPDIRVQWVLTPHTCAGMPAIVLTLGGIFLPDTPNSLIQRGRDAEGRAVLVRIRGTTDVDEEFNDIKDAVKQSESVRAPPCMMTACSNNPCLQLCSLVLGETAELQAGASMDACSGLAMTLALQQQAQRTACSP